MSRHSLRRPMSAAAVALALGGCGITNPYQHPASRPASSPTTWTSGPTPGARAAQANGNPGEHDEGAPRLAPLGSGASAPSARAALERFAQLYVNWRAGQLPARARQLAAISTGQARAEVLRLADRATVLARYRVTNTGAVTAIAPGQGPQQGRWVVVTDELTSGTGPYLGLPATSHVSWVTLTHTNRGYVVSGWYPAN